MNRKKYKIKLDEMNIGTGITRLTNNNQTIFFCHVSCYIIPLSFTRYKKNMMKIFYWYIFFRSSSFFFLLPQTKAQMFFHTSWSFVCFLRVKYIKKMNSNGIPLDIYYKNTDIFSLLFVTRSYICIAVKDLSYNLVVIYLISLSVLRMLQKQYTRKY